ncbi:kelch-like protein 23 [Bombina bombina]|uniref:kelch-like protein 23 n=1 Tax=Bombina bombina TaxID=8345 RepID=UPI00235AFE29|nr:kelch-like protein 23 [Bombina bombina]XP_053554392.1 kelch-like protein 23 [Bombina bombina]
MSLKDQQDYCFIYNDPTHHADVLDSFLAFYKEGLFTDVTLVSSTGKVFHCHKAVLAACSNYFKVMFTADMKEKSKTQIKLSGIDHTILQALINYTYTAQIGITARNVQNLIQAADQLHFVSVKDACEQFLVRHLDVGNCLGMHSFAEFHVCPDLEKESRRIIVSQFDDVWIQDEFVEISLEKVLYIFSQENLNVWKEDTLLRPLARWLAHNCRDRIQYIHDLLKCVKLDIDVDYLRTSLALHKKHLLNENKIQSLLYFALRTQTQEMSNRTSANMLVIGGYYWHPLSEVHVWDPISNNWIQGADMPDHTRESYSATNLGANIYITGGYRTDNIEALSTVWIYNAELDEWKEGCPMLQARYYHCSVTLNGCVYVLGGYRKGAPAEEAEFYDPLKKNWVPIANMIKGVGNATACVLRDTIYVSGGHYGYRGSCTYDKIQSYRTDLNEWSIFAVCPHPEYGLCSVALQNKLYLIGGQTTTTDCYDLENNEWKEMSPTMERRMECGAAVINGFIYITGGYSYSKGTYLQSIEKYNPESDKWEVVGSLPSPMRSHGCVSVYNV